MAPTDPSRLRYTGPPALWSWKNSRNWTENVAACAATSSAARAPSVGTASENAPSGPGSAHATAPAPSSIAADAASIPGARASGVAPSGHRAVRYRLPTASSTGPVSVNPTHSADTSGSASLYTASTAAPPSASATPSARDASNRSIRTHSAPTYVNSGGNAIASATNPAPTRGRPRRR